MKKWTRRAFIGAGTVAGGGFLLGVAGFTFAPGRHTLVSADAAEKGQLTTWITVTPEESPRSHPALRHGPGRADRARNDGR